MAGLKSTLKHRLSLWLSKGENVPFHILFHNKWNREFWREWSRALRYRSGIKKKKIRRIFITSYSRSGTHNFYAHFHYHPSVFAFGENIYYDADRDPYQLSWKLSKTSPAHFLFGSLFFGQGLQDKKGKNLSHVFLLTNHYLKSLKPFDDNRLQAGDRVIFYQRNFIRTLYSMDQCAKKLGKDHFLMTEENFRLAVRRHRSKLEEMLLFVDRDPRRFLFCFHEIFCANPAAEMERLAHAIDLPLPRDPSWNDPQKFFKRCYGSGEVPEVRAGSLYCPLSDTEIRGKGGSYNPLPPIRLKRTLSDPVETWLDDARLSRMQSAFGEDLVSFWLTDAGFNYEKTSTHEIVERIRRSLHEAQPVENLT